MTPERAVEWMAERGHTSYRKRIAVLNGDIAIAIVDGNRQGVAKAQEEIREIQMEAYDRIMDWETDPEWM